MTCISKHVRVPLVVALLSALSSMAPLLNAQPTITACASGFMGKDIAINHREPHDAFIPAGAVVKHISSVSPGSASCAFGSLLPDISLGVGVVESWGVALDSSGNLYVAAGSGIFTITSILQIAPPYSGPPVVFYSAGVNLRSIAIRDHILYAADFGAGTMLRFELPKGPSSVKTFATIPGVFGLWTLGHDDLVATSNAGFTGVAFGVGTNDVKHVTKSGVVTIASGLSYPQGIAGDRVNLYIAAGALVYTVPTSGGAAALYAGSPILFSQGITEWRDGGYTTDSNASGDVYKFTLLSQ